MSEELKAIEEVAKTIEGYKAELGKKAEKADFEKVQGALKDITENISKYNDSEMKEAVKQFNEANEKLNKEITELKEEIREQKDNSKQSFKANELFKSEDVESFVKTVFDGNTKTSKEASIKLNGNVLFPYRNKAAEIMSTAFYTGAGTVPDVFTGRLVDPRLYQRTRKRNLILDHIPIESIGVPTLYYMEKQETAGPVNSSTDVGSADFITVAGQKPLRSFRVSTGKVDAKKVAIFSTVADKLLRDVASLENWIREDLVPEVLEEYNDKLLNSDGTGNDPLGLLENAVSFTASDAFDGTVYGPTEIDAIVAAAAAMAVSKEQPVKALVSVDRWYKLHVIKDQDARYQESGLVYTNAAGQLFIAGVEVVGVDDEDVDGNGLLLLGADLGFKIRNYGSLVFERGLNGEDFRHDRTSFRCFQEVLSYIPAHRYNSVMFDDFDTIIAAIDAGSL